MNAIDSNGNIIIRQLTKDEVAALPFRSNWIGTLGSGNYGSKLVKTRKQAEAWVRRLVKGGNWNSKSEEWAVFEEFHYKTGNSIGWGATCVDLPAAN